MFLKTGSIITCLSTENDPVETEKHMIQKNMGELLEQCCWRDEKGEIQCPWGGFGFE